jgi:hypothetical protein
MSNDTVQPPVLEVDVLAPTLPTEPPHGEDFDRAWRPWQERNYIEGFLSRVLIARSDYGTIPVRYKDKNDPEGKRWITKESKSTLFKPGAEKLCQWAQLRAHYEPGPMQLLEQLKNNRAAVLRCELVTRWSEVVGEGLGAGALAEPGKSWDNNPNSLIKIMKKRALVDAVLSVFALSDRFTQDLEDFPRGLDADPGDPPDDGDPGWDDMAVNRAHPTEGKTRPSTGAVRAAVTATDASTVRGPGVRTPVVVAQPPQTIDEAKEAFSVLCFEALGLPRTSTDEGVLSVARDFTSKYIAKIYGPAKDNKGRRLRDPLDLDRYIALIGKLRDEIHTGTVPQF